MKQSQLIWLVGGVAVLGAVYLLTDDTPGGHPSTATQVRLLADIGGEKITKIRLEQGAESFDLELRDGQWHIPSRGGYPADTGKVRALMLKLFDLEVSQRLPENPGSFGALGVAEDSVKAGRGKITLSDASGKPVVILRLGEARKGKNDSSPLGGMLNGQYVRRDDRSDVYLMANPIALSFGIASWIDANLINVLPTAVLSVESKRVPAGGPVSGGEATEFELVRTGESEPDTGFPVLVPAGGVPPGKELQRTAVSQTRSALENLRVTDAFAVESPEVKDLTFDVVTTYRTHSGLVYHVATAKQGDRYFAKLSVEFDQSIVEKVKADAAKSEAAAPTPSPTPIPSISPTTVPAPAASPATVGGAATPSPSPSPSPKPTPVPLPTFSTEEDARKLQKQLSPWVYELVSFQAQQLRKTRTDLLEPPAPPPPPPGAAGAQTKPGAAPVLGAPEDTNVSPVPHSPDTGHTPRK